MSPEEKEKLTKSVMECNKKINEAAFIMRDSAKNLGPFLEEFRHQRNLLSRVEMAIQIITAATNHLENLRPRIFMIEDQDEIRKQKMKILSKKSFKGIKKGYKNQESK